MGKESLQRVEQALRARTELEKRAAQIEAGLSPQERDLLSRLAPWDSPADIERIARELR